MKKAEITHPRGTAEFVIEHARWQQSRGRNPSEPFKHIRDPRKAFELASRVVAGLPPLCGCGGEIIQGTGCDKYLDSSWYGSDVAEESHRWTCGLGFGSAVLACPSDATMSMHLQCFGLSPAEAVDVLRPISVS